MGWLDFSSEIADLLGFKKNFILFDLNITKALDLETEVRIKLILYNYEMTCSTLVNTNASLLQLRANKHIAINIYFMQ